jgi:hypothetical protein
MLPANLEIDKQYLVEWEENEYVGTYKGPVNTRWGDVTYHFTSDSRLFYLDATEVDAYVDYPYNPVPLDTTPGAWCRHEYVNVGFFTLTMACKHCGRDMPPEPPKRQAEDYVFNAPPIVLGGWIFHNQSQTPVIITHPSGQSVTLPGSKP